MLEILHENRFKRLGDRLEFQGDSIHAVALPSRLGPVVEHVAKDDAAAREDVNGGEVLCQPQRVPHPLAFRCHRQNTLINSQRAAA